jgi:hypothetical protein
LWLALSKGSNRVCIPHQKRETILVSEKCSLVFRILTMDKIKKPVILIGVDISDKQKVLALELGSCVTNTYYSLN